MRIFRTRKTRMETTRPCTTSRISIRSKPQPSFYDVLTYFRYQFNIRKFPKADIPDSIAALNTPMLSADHRVIKKMKNMPGITPHLTGRKLDKGKMAQMKVDALTKRKL